MQNPLNLCCSFCVFVQALPGAKDEWFSVVSELTVFLCKVLIFRTRIEITKRLTMQPPKSYSVGEQCSSRAAYRQARRHPARLQGSLVRAPAPQPDRPVQVHQQLPPAAESRDEIKDIAKDLPDPTKDAVQFTDKILLLGDFNIHVDLPSSLIVTDFNTLLDCLGLIKSVNIPTHTRGHTLDLLITRGLIVSNLSVSDVSL
ncbi:UNVERIFIED_CONTAM: hypothetical protein FKN15_047564 [Acipenser sinensis]